MDKYLKLLLELENTIIIPGLGALMVTSDNTKDLMFNEYLKFNDGKLDKFITENSTMDEQEAKNFVAKYVREIQAKLDIGESYDMFEFGSFAKDKEGKVQFLPWDPNSNAQTESNKDKEETNLDNTEALKAQEEEEKRRLEEKQKEAEKKAETERITKKEREERERIAQERINAELKAKEEKNKAEEERKRNVYIPPVTENKVETTTENTVSTPLEPVAVNPTKSSDEEIKNPQDVEEKKKKKRGGFFWFLLVLLILIAIGGVLVGLNYDKVKDYMGWNNPAIIEQTTPENVPENKEEELNEIEEDIDIIDSVALNEVEQNDTSLEEVEEITNVETSEPETTEAVVTSSTGNFHIVGGSFGNEANAQRLVEEMRNKGYDSKILGQFGSLTTVVIQSYSSKEEAQSTLSKVREDVDGAYVMKHPK